MTPTSTLIALLVAALVTVVVFAVLLDVAHRRLDAAARRTAQLEQQLRDERTWRQTEMERCLRAEQAAVRLAARCAMAPPPSKAAVAQQLVVASARVGAVAP